MVSKKDLLEASSFSRQRILSAFVSGARAGPGVEAPRHGRAVVSGLVLAALVVAASVVAGLLSPAASRDWVGTTMVVSEDTGQAYVVLPGQDEPAAADGERVVLHPVANITSARLILGADPEPTLAPQAEIDHQVIAGEVGIPGAPVVLPPPGRLVETGWTACAGDGRAPTIRLVDDTGVRPLPDAAAVVVAARDDHYVIASAGEGPLAAVALPLPDGPLADNLLGALHLPARVLAPSVSPRWLDLFPVGSTLGWESFGLTHVGDRPLAWDAAGVPRRVRVGDVVQEAGGSAVVMTVDGPADLDPFAFAVYTHAQVPGRGAPRVVRVDRFADLAKTELPSAPLGWPSDVPEPLAGEPCALLDAGAGVPPLVRLAAGDVGADPDRGTVEPGRGALVQLRSATDDRDPVQVLVDDAGRAHRLEDDAVTQLGYAEVTAPVVPRAWVRLFEEGVPLSRDRALRPVP